MPKVKLIGLILMVISIVGSVGCVGMSPLLIQTRHDMDDVVSQKGMPLQIEEMFIGGPYPRHVVTLYYSDAMYQFQTDASKSYTVLMTSTTISFSGMPQSPLPVWFKAKYPNLNWEGVPTK
jgi:hypothetical protein